MSERITPSPFGSFSLPSQPLGRGASSSHIPQSQGSESSSSSSEFRPTDVDEKPPAPSPPHQYQSLGSFNNPPPGPESQSQRKTGSIPDRDKQPSIHAWQEVAPDPEPEAPAAPAVPAPTKEPPRTLILQLSLSASQEDPHT